LVFVRLERCNGTLTWCKPPWADPRRPTGATAAATSSAAATAASAGTGGIASNAGVGATSINTGCEMDSVAVGLGLGNGCGLDQIEEAVSPGLRLKYTNRSGDCIAYAEEGFIDLAQVKDVCLFDDVSVLPECARAVTQRAFVGATLPGVLRITFGVSLADNRSVYFVGPPSIGRRWAEALASLSATLRTEDVRMLWLKEQYLFLYFQDDLCMGPLAADAIKVRPLLTYLYSQRLLAFTSDTTELARVLLQSSYIFQQESAMKVRVVVPEDAHSFVLEKTVFALGKVSPISVYKS
jgi:hypothetical protein